MRSRPSDSPPGLSRHLSFGKDGTGLVWRFSRPPAEYRVAVQPTACRRTLSNGGPPIANRGFFFIRKPVTRRDKPEQLRCRYPQLARCDAPADLRLPGIAEPAVPDPG